MTQSLQAPAQVFVKQDPNASPSGSSPGQSSLHDFRNQHHYMQESAYHYPGDRVEYVDMQGNHLVHPHTAPMTPLYIKVPKYEPFAQSGAVEPPFRGYCENTHDALILFEAAKRGIIPRVTRRLTDREKAAMIKSGAVFVFDEHESNIKRWTDGMSWSPSRIFGNYLTYREIVDKSEISASANAAATTANDSSGVAQNSQSRPFPRNPLPGTTRNRPHLSAASVSGLELPNNTSRPRSASDSQPQPSEAIRNGKKGGQSAKSFWRPNGLVKRTISVLVNGYHQHLVSYYNPVDVHEDRLYRPRDIPVLARLEIGDEYLRSDSFRLPIQTALSADGKLQYIGEPSNIPGQSNQQNQQDTFPMHPTVPAPPATAPIRQQTVYNVSPQGYTFATVPKEVVLDHNSHSRPSTGTSHGSVITPMSPLTGGNYYDNYLEQEQQKAMANTAPVVWQVPLPTTHQRPHTTQFAGGASMSRQLSEGTGRDKMSARMRASSRYQPYGSPDQANFPQTAMQLVLPGHPVRPTVMRRTPSYQNGQATYVPMTPVVETVTNSPNMTNVVMLNSAGIPIEMQRQKMSPSQTAISQDSPNDMHQIPYTTSEQSSTPQYSHFGTSQPQPVSSVPEGSLGMASPQHMRTFSNSYSSLDDMAIVGSLQNSGWQGMAQPSIPSQYMEASKADMVRSFSGPPGNAMNAYHPSITMQSPNQNGDNLVSASNGHWMVPVMHQDPQSRTMMSSSYQHQPMMSMGPPPVVLSGWQTSLAPAYQDAQDSQSIQTVYYSQMPSQAQ